MVELKGDRNEYGTRVCSLCGARCINKGKWTCPNHGKLDDGLVEVQ